MSIQSKCRKIFAQLQSAESSAAAICRKYRRRKRNVRSEIHTINSHSQIHIATLSNVTVAPNENSCSFPAAVA